jgi:hypothetical protein
MNVNVLHHCDLLLALAAMAIERFEQRGEAMTRSDIVVVHKVLRRGP